MQQSCSLKFRKGLYNSASIFTRTLNVVNLQGVENFVYKIQGVSKNYKIMFFCCFFNLQPLSYGHYLML